MSWVYCLHGLELGDDERRVIVIIYSERWGPFKMATYKKYRLVGDEIIKVMSCLALQYQG
jgi:hypothetical protein